MRYVWVLLLLAGCHGFSGVDEEALMNFCNAKNRHLPEGSDQLRWASTGCFNDPANRTVFRR